MLTTFIIVASITFVSMISPGPDMMLIIRASAKSHWAAFLCVAGISLGVAFHVTLAIMGVATIIETSATIYSVMKLMGATYLIYVGVMSLKNSKKIDIKQNIKNKEAASLSDFRDGLFCNLLNPKVTVFILAVFTQVIDPSTPAISKALYGGFIVLQAFVVWNIFVMLVRTNIVLEFIQRFQIWINRIAGIALIGFGGCIGS